MKQLQEYETPITDAAYFSQGATMYSIAGEMKQIERRLAACREALEIARVGMASVAVPNPNELAVLGGAFELVTETLELTKP